MPTIDWKKEQINPEQFFSLPQSERLQIINRHIPLHIKIPFFVVGVMGILLNCLVSAFAATVVFNHMMLAGNTEFSARFWSLALALFSIQILNSGMDKTSKWALDRLYGNGKRH